MILKCCVASWILCHESEQNDGGRTMNWQDGEWFCAASSRAQMYDSCDEIIGISSEIAIKMFKGKR